MIARVSLTPSVCNWLQMYNNPVNVVCNECASAVHIMQNYEDANQGCCGKKTSCLVTVGSCIVGSSANYAVGRRGALRALP